MVSSDNHVPVLLNEVLDSFSVFANKQALSYLDGTFGRGGHFSAIVEKYQPKSKTACDQDLSAIEYGQKLFSDTTFFHLNFADFAERNSEKFDMILLDLGVSSPQLDNADRGFSFNKDGPLDMRMNQNQQPHAEFIVNTFSEEDLNRIFKMYGEIINPSRVVRAIVNDRKNKAFTSTLQLAQLIERVDGWRKKGFHPATQYFMALRLVVNKELDVVEQAVPKFMQALNDGGRLSIITFHSLEDRLVKNLFKESELGFLVYKKVIVPSEEECRINPRARSAKLRVFQKGIPQEKPDKFELRRQGLR